MNEMNKMNKNKGQKGKRKRDRKTEINEKGENIAYRYFCGNLGYLMIREAVKIK